MTFADKIKSMFRSKKGNIIAGLRAWMKSDEALVEFADSPVVAYWSKRGAIYVGFGIDPHASYDFVIYGSEAIAQAREDRWNEYPEEAKHLLPGGEMALYDDPDQLG